MRIQCIICQELFENRDDEVIAALACGHTFHFACLNQWLETGKTCPSCRKAVNRKQVINRLYFDAPEGVEEEVDSNTLTNQIDGLKLEVKRSNYEKSQILKEKEDTLDKLKKAEKSKKAIEAALKEEKSKNSANLCALRYFESQQTALEKERKECKEIKQKLVRLERCESLLNGCESDAAEIISNTGEGPNAIQTLSRQLAFLKREYEKLKLEKKHFKDNYEKISMRDGQRNKQMNDVKTECESLREQLERSESDLRIAEREIEYLRRRNSKFKRVLKSPDAVDKGSSSFTNLMNDSDYLSKFTVSTPKLDSASHVIDLDKSPDLFDSPAKGKENVGACVASTSENTASTQSKEEKSRKRPLESCDETDRNVKNIKLVKNNIGESQSTQFQSTQSQPVKLKKQNSGKDIAEPQFAIAGMNIFRKKTTEDRSSITRKGYDGFGGHTTFVSSQLTNKTKKGIVGAKKNMSKPSTLTSMGFSLKS